MELKEIEIKNFGPYRETGAHFKSDGGSDIHVIEGPQGAGKTNFLKAIKWALYGDEGPTTNYKANYNDSARSEEEEEMHVRLDFKEGGQNYQLIREIDRFDHRNKRAHEKATLIAPEKRIEDQDKIEDKIGEILPEQLQDFFFLDGEKIRDLVGEESGKKVKDEIETVLKHQAIINSQHDLEKFLEDKIERREEIEKETNLRTELSKEKEELQEERREKKKRLEEAHEDLREAKKAKTETEDRLEELEEELINDLNNVDEDLTNLRSEKKEELTKLRDSWSQLDDKIISDKAEELKSNIESEIEEKENRIKEIREHNHYQDLKEEANQIGECPVCGSSINEIEVEKKQNMEEKINRLEDEKSNLREMKESLNIQTQEKNPSDHIVKIENLNEEINEKETEKENLQNQLTSKAEGKPVESKKEELKENLNTLIEKIRNLKDEKEELKEERKNLKKKIQEKTDEMNEKAGNKDLKEINQKIEIIEQSVEKLGLIREEHVREKRKKIKEEMNKVFADVSQSEFMNKKYEGVDFKGEPGEETSYVLQLIKNSGDRKDMEYHTPSAGEAQVTALSFIFGLNRYAKYSTTIVFDTVAGRLDLANSKGQGKFFAQLEDPLILLVTDAELENMGQELKKNIENHYEIKLDNNNNSYLDDK